MWRRRLLVCAALLGGHADGARAQAVTQRGFVEGAATAFPRRAPADPTRGVADLLVRDEVFVAPAAWIQLAAGFEARANSHRQVDTSWRFDFSDRGVRRPRLSVRRLSATMTRGPVTVDVGKQFIRWGRTDIVSPTDRFAPRDFLNVVDSEFLAVTGVRGTVQAGSETVEAAWVPRVTPSRSPLVDQRWGVLPSGPPGLSLVEAPPEFGAAQGGIRWRRTAGAAEYSVSFFDGVNHLPDIRLEVREPPGPAPIVEVTRVYPRIRTYGVDWERPVPWFTIKVEAAYLTSPSRSTDEYGLYVLQVERQRGEWMFIGGYAGEVGGRRRSALTFAPDRGISRALVARVSRTLDPTRTFDLEGAVRQNGRGAYAKAEYSQARGQHLRATITAVAIGGRRDDFLGQYRHNSHLALTVRFSF